MISHLLPVVRALMLAAAVAAVLLARRLPSHRPVAAFLAWQALVMLARWALLELYLRDAIAAAGGDIAAGVQPAPLVGWARAAGIAHNAGWLAWPAALAMLALWSFGRRVCASCEFIYDSGHVEMTKKMFSGLMSRWTMTPALAWLAAVAFIAVTYPAGRPYYPHLYAGTEVAALVVGLGAAGSWGLRAWGRDGLGFSRSCVLFILGCGVVTLAGPYAHGVFSTWWLANAVQLVMYSGLILAQGSALWMLSRSR